MTIGIRLTNSSRKFLAHMLNISLFVTMLLGILMTWMIVNCAEAFVFAYIPNFNDNTVSVIDTATDSVITTIAVGNGPRGIAISPSGTRVYVTHSLSNAVYVIDTATNTVINTIDVDDTSEGVAISPDGLSLYVASLWWSKVYVIDTATETVVSTIPVGNGEGIAISPTGTYVYVGNDSYFYGYIIAVIDASTNTVINQTWPSLSNRPFGIAMNPQGTRLYATIDWSNKVAVIDANTYNVIATVSVHGNDPWTYPTGVAVNPDGRRVYVANRGGDCVSVIDTFTNTLLDTIQMTEGTGAYGIAVHPDGTRVYVANCWSDTVTVIDTATNTIIDSIRVGSGPVAFGNFIATWPPIVSPVIIATAGTGGSISPSGNVRVTYGRSQSFSIIPDKYYRVLDVKVDGVSVGPVKQYAFGTVTTDHIITATFALTNIAVESPNGGETLDTGTVQDISWTYIDNPGKVISIELLKGGTLFKTINPGVAIGKNGSNSYKWHIQSKLPTGNDYQIRISSKDNKDFSDTSDNFFSIQ
jgi:YVTN family beta-propeller protein